MRIWKMTGAALVATALLLPAGVANASPPSIKVKLCRSFVSWPNSGGPPVCGRLSHPRAFEPSLDFCCASLFYSRLRRFTAVVEVTGATDDTVLWIDDRQTAWKLRRHRYFTPFIDGGAIPGREFTFAVTNPGVGNYSKTVRMTMANPTPVITRLTATLGAKVFAGARGFTLSVVLSSRYCVSDMIVNFGDAAKWVHFGAGGSGPPALCSLQVPISAEDIAKPGRIPVTVWNLGIRNVTKSAAMEFVVPEAQ